MFRNPELSLAERSNEVKMSTKMQNLALSVPRSGSIESYVSAVSSINMLTADEEKSLAVRLFDDGDLEAARKLVMSHLRFVVYVAKSYAGYGLPQADLIQEGNIGLMKAVKRFDPSVGVRLVSFAVHWIKAEIHEFVLKNWRIVKVATTKAQRKLFFNLRKAKKRLGWFTHAEVQKVAEELGVSTKEVLQMEARMSSQDAAFDLTNDDDESSAFAPAQYLEDKTTDVEMDVINSDHDKNASNSLYSAIKTLDARSQHIIETRWLSDDKMTLQDLADEYQVSAERVRQIEKNALKKLQAAMV